MACDCCFHGPIIWGNVYDHHGLPMKDSLVQLVLCIEAFSPHSPVIFQTFSDINGYYALELPANYKGRYRIIITSADKIEQPPQKRKNTISYY